MDLLPGLWVGCLLLLLRTALRRWYDAVPDGVLAASGAAVLLLFGPVLFGGQFLLPLDNLRGNAPFQNLAPTEPHGNLLQGDLIQLIGPSQVAVREALAQRRWPLWNPAVGAGMPLLADPQAQAFQPLQLLGLALPWMRAAGAVAALRVLVALVFSFLWMRRMGLGAGPALAGAFGYGLGGFVVLWAGWPLANPAALLPLGLYAAALCHQRGERRDLLLLTVAAVCLLLALGMYLVFTRTRLGMMIRAGSTNREMVQSLGIDIKFLYRVVFAAGVAIAVLAGMVAAPVSSVYPGMGNSVLIICFVVVVIGGIGSIRGALLAALLIGAVDTFGKVLLPQAAGVLVYVLMALILLWKPDGLFKAA